MATANDGSGRLFIVDQAGLIRIVGPDGTLMPEPFLDMTGQIVPLRTDYDERGLLGLAFHPDYANNGRIFIYYTAPLREGAPAGWDHTNVLAELNVSSDNPNQADLATLKTVLQIDQPQFNHNAGHITFGPDGYLYIPIGDGGGANDVDEGHTPGLGNAQDLTNLHGSILRIDVNGEPGSYTIPADNPFAAADDNAADEIYAYGLRNPYHIAFDRGGNNDLFASDAGQDLYEEIDIITAGGNYGWNIKEGTHCFDPNNPETPPAECASTGADGQPLIDPIIEYGHDEVGVVAVGGYVYRGSAMPDLEGYYIFGDYTKSPAGPPDGTLLWAEASDEGGMWSWGELKVAGMDNERIGANVLAFGQDDNGELYVLTSESSAPVGDTGKVWKLVAAEAAAAEATAEGTAETGAATAPEATEVPMTTPESSG
ncbi:MAG: PQQ-dependent sugar dehydrogenase [Chloroflexi bacterium]|nr:PQQ-dependent sugar dehydrogenase [Chloroflexota bacterium]